GPPVARLPALFCCKCIPFSDQPSVVCILAILAFGSGPHERKPIRSSNENRVSISRLTREVPESSPYFPLHPPDPPATIASITRPRNSSGNGTFPSSRLSKGTCHG